MKSLVAKVSLALLLTIGISAALPGCYKDTQGNTVWSTPPTSVEDAEATGKPLPAGGAASIQTGQTAGGVAGGIARVTPAAPAADLIGWIVGTVGTGLASLIAWNKSKKATSEKKAKEFAQTNSDANFARAANLGTVVKDLVNTVEVVKKAKEWDSATKTAVSAVQKNSLTSDIVNLIREKPAVSPSEIAWRVDADAPASVSP